MKTRRTRQEIRDTVVATLAFRAPRFSPTPLRNIYLALEGSIAVTDNPYSRLDKSARSLKFHGLLLDASGSTERRDAPSGRSGKSPAPGYKYNLPDLNAAIALCSVGGRKLDALLIARCAAIAAQYYSVQWQTARQPLSSASVVRHIYARHLFIIRVDEARCVTGDQPLACWRRHRHRAAFPRRAYAKKYYRERFALTLLSFPEGTAADLLTAALPRTLTEVTLIGGTPFIR
ncbi:DegT/DnrJ/EryC1/StrS family aminotransferase [Salmonella enterica subsp. enterica]|nr:DegT/DnrJ/EryC1/StrS family aminotransferase [Salmonella enterica subsp. enterica]